MAFPKLQFQVSQHHPSRYLLPSPFTYTTDPHTFGCIQLTHPNLLSCRPTPTACSALPSMLPMSVKWMLALVAQTSLPPCGCSATQPCSPASQIHPLFIPFCILHHLSLRHLLPGLCHSLLWVLYLTRLQSISQTAATKIF